MKPILFFALFMFASVNFLFAQDEDDEDEKTETANCGGTERWSQKVLTDNLASTVVFTPHPATIAHLVSITTPTPSTTMARYQPVEDSTYIVTTKITIKKAETDSDFHLVLSDGTHTMIGEIPDPICASVVASPHASQFQACRNFINANIAKGNVSSVNIGMVTITGVAFVDPPHGQTGAAPNNLELHPILDIHFATATEIAEYNLDDLISVSPNPSPGKIHVQCGPHRFLKADIYNAIGENIGSSLSPDFDLPDQAEGIYFIQVRTEKGSCVKKVILRK